MSLQLQLLSNGGQRNIGILLDEMLSCILMHSLLKKSIDTASLTDDLLPHPSLILSLSIYQPILFLTSYTPPIHSLPLDFIRPPMITRC